MVVFADFTELTETAEISVQPAEGRGNNRASWHRGEAMRHVTSHRPAIVPGSKGHRGGGGAEKSCFDLLS